MTGPQNPQLPVVQKLRIQFAKRGRMRFASHRDFARAFERAVRRAGLPIAHSEGFNPHPKISYAGAAPTGTSSDAEFLEISLTEKTDPIGVQISLNQALPDGFDIESVEISDPSRPMMEMLQASQWRIKLPDLSPEQAKEAIESFMNTPEIMVERMTKKGIRRFDCRAAVLEMAVAQGECAILDVVVQHLTPAVRPDDVLLGLQQVGGVDTLSAPQVHRIAQGPLDLWSRSSPTR